MNCLYCNMQSLFETFEIDLILCTQVTNTLTCGALLASGDFLQQKIEKAQGQNQGLDTTRCGMTTSHPTLSQ